MTDAKLWGGRFIDPPAAALERLSSSIHFDAALTPVDVLQSRAHVKELNRCGYVSDDDYTALDEALSAIAVEYATGTWTPAANDEDIHSAIERTLIERLGADVGGRIRTGRSRNDQVATDFRLYLLAAAGDIQAGIASLANTILDVAGLHTESVCAGFTHLQHAQPVTFGHELAKHAWALIRDLDRLHDWAVRTNVSPMGAGALAGNSLGLNPERIAKDLGFADIARNSIDAVSDRDFVAEFLFVTSMLGIHLSRIGEEICLWASSEFGWIRLHDSWSTGSSLMPQKRNPDVAELARGKAGRLIGSLVSVLTMLKGLPFGYNRDQQEDKEATFDAIATVLLVLPALEGLISSMTIDVEKLAASVAFGHSTATDIAEWLVRQGVAFREAHEIAGACVRTAEINGVDVSALTAEDLVAVDARLIGDAAQALSPIASVHARNSVSGPAPDAVRAQIAAARAAIEAKVSL